MLSENILFTIAAAKIRLTFTTSVWQETVTRHGESV